MQQNLKKFFFLFAIFSSSLVFAEDKLVTELSSNAANLYTTLVLMLQNFRWVFAIFPIVAIVISIAADFNKITESKEMMQQQDRPIKGDELTGMVIHVVSVLVGFYIIYGIFGLTYADASSMGQMWTVLVTSFWGGLI